MKNLLTVGETARFLGNHYLTVIRAINAGRLKATRYGHQFLVEPADILEFIKTRRPYPKKVKKPEIFETFVGTKQL